MTRSLVFVLVALTSGESLGAQSGIDSAGAEVEAIRALRESSNAAIAGRDTAAIGATLAPDVVVVSSTSVMVMGRDANVRVFAEQFATRPDVSYRRTPVTIRIGPVWSMASEQGRWIGRWTARDGVVSISGSYFAKWRRIGGRWLIESETYVPEACAGSDYCRTGPP